MGFIVLMILILGYWLWGGGGENLVETKGDLHIHTTCSDGAETYEEVIQKALSLGYGFVAITDHGFGGVGWCMKTGFCKPQVCEETIKKCREEKRLLCIPGQEVSGKVHLVALGITTGINDQLPLARQVEEIHRQGGLAIAAHPLTKGVVYTEEQLTESGIDGVECDRGRDEELGKLKTLVKDHGLFCVSNSDTHNLLMMGLTNNVCRGKIESFASLKGALKGGKCDRMVTPEYWLLNLFKYEDWVGKLQG